MNWIEICLACRRNFLPTVMLFQGGSALHQISFADNFEPDRFRWIRVSTSTPGGRTVSDAVDSRDKSRPITRNFRYQLASSAVYLTGTNALGWASHPGVDYDSAKGGAVRHSILCSVFVISIHQVVVKAEFLNVII